MNDQTIALNHLDAGTLHALPASMNESMIFIGECRSPTAQRKGWVWKDGRLAAKPLFEALRAMGVDPAAQLFLNLWTDPPLRRTKSWRPQLSADVMTVLRTSALLKVALGARVSTQLTKLCIEHVAIVHPAARGAIRKRKRYLAHVAERLTR